MIALRPYQEVATHEVRSHFKARRKRVILCLPTGAGKTVVFSALTKATLQKDLLNRVLILTNRIELLSQAGGTLERFGIIPELITAKNKRVNMKARCYVGMVETVYNRAKVNPELLQNITLVIIDECHYGNFKKLFSLFSGNTFVVGATATPLSASKKDPLSNYYDALVNCVQIGELVEQGFLSPAITYAPKTDRAGLKKDSTGDYSDASQMNMFDRREVYAGLIKRYADLCEKYNDGKPLKTICFNVNIEHSLRVTSEFNEAGYPAQHVDGLTEWAERESIITAYKTGAFPIICNVGILNAGFDDADTQCIIMNRATTSVPLWLQSCGRGSRIAPGKKRFLILDMAENWKELGLWESERDWESLYCQKKSESNGVAPVKSCPACEALVAVSLRVCPQCGEDFPEKLQLPAPESEFAEVALADVTPTISPELARLDRPVFWPKLSVGDLHAIHVSKPKKAGWVIHVIRERATNESQFRTELGEFARLKGYRKGWADHQQYA